jgi:hypothetical protein
MEPDREDSKIQIRKKMEPIGKTAKSKSKKKEITAQCQACSDQQHRDPPMRQTPRQPPQEMDDAELASTSQTSYHLVA